LVPHRLIRKGVHARSLSGSGCTSCFHKTHSYGTKDCQDRGKPGAAPLADRRVIVGTHRSTKLAEREIGPWGAPIDEPACAENRNVGADPAPIVRLGLWTRGLLVRDRT